MTDYDAIAARGRRQVRDQFPDFIKHEDAQFIWHTDEVLDDGIAYSHSFVTVPKSFLGEYLMPLGKSTGADTEGWPHSASNNIHLIFGEMIGASWTSYREYITALAEFAKIDDAEWVRRILQGIGCEVGAFYNSEDYDVFQPLQSIDDVERLRDEIIKRKRDM